MRLKIRTMQCVLLCAVSAAGAQQSYPNKPLRLIVGFAPVGMFATLSYALDVHPSLPAKTLRDFIALARAKPGAINKAMTRPEMKDKLVSQGADALSGSPADLAALVQRERAKFAKLIKAAGVRVE